MTHPGPLPSPAPPAPPAFAPPPRPRRAGFAVAVLTGALLVGGGAGVGGAAAWTAWGPEPGPSAAAASSDASSDSAVTVADTPDRQAADGSVEDVAATVLPSVVALEVQGGGSGGSGSGVVLSEDGLILTNDHVVSLGGTVDPGSADITVKFNDGTKAAATVVGTDPLTDVAVVQVEGVDGLQPITVGKSEQLDVGEQVVAVGSPYGLEATVTSGIVSALDRPVDVGQDRQGNVTAYPAIQTDAAINPGNSGGPLVDMDGHLVGINASIRTAGTTMNDEAGSIGLGFAIPIDEVLPIIEQIENGETPTHARLGVEISDVAGSDGQAQAEVADGARIQNVSAGSAAGDAGLREGDVITAVDDHRIAGADSLVATVRSYRPGDEVTVTYLRDGEEHTTTLTLASDADVSPTS